MVLRQAVLNSANDQWTDPDVMEAEIHTKVVGKTFLDVVTLEDK
jgi:hypothetical protein